MTGPPPFKTTFCETSPFPCQQSPHQGQLFCIMFQGVLTRFPLALYCHYNCILLHQTIITGYHPTCWSGSFVAHHSHHYLWVWAVPARWLMGGLHISHALLQPLLCPSAGEVGVQDWISQGTKDAPFHSDGWGGGWASEMVACHIGSFLGVRRGWGADRVVLLVHGHLHYTTGVEFARVYTHCRQTGGNDTQWIKKRPPTCWEATPLRVQTSHWSSGPWQLKLPAD